MRPCEAWDGQGCSPCYCADHTQEKWEIQLTQIKWQKNGGRGIWEAESQTVHGLEGNDLSAQPTQGLQGQVCGW